MPTLAWLMLAAAQVASAAEPAAGVLTKAPELVTFVEAPWPADQPQTPVSVVLAVTLATDGTVEDATVQESGGEAFDAAALAAVRRFVFTPAEVDGVPARIQILYRYDFVVRAEAPTTAAFAGVVMDRDAHQPLAGVTVTLGDGRSVVTDDQGRFAFEDVLPGPLTVTLEGERLTALSTEETFVAGERLEATYEVFLAEEGEEADDMEILVSAPTIKRQAVSTEMSAEEARKVPGTGGDVLRVVESMPGVARASMGTGALVVWGAAPGDTGVYVDGVPVPRLYHDGGLRSVVSSDFVKSVELVPGGYGAAYGRSLGGLVSVTTAAFDDGLHASAAADVYDVSGSVHGPLGEKVRFGVGGRYGWVGPLLGAFYPDVEDFFPIPHYRDAQARLGVDLGANRTLDLTGLWSSDRTESTAPSDDPAREASEERKLDFGRVSLRYAHDVGDGSQVTAIVFGGADAASQVARFGLVDTSVTVDTALAGARVAYRARVAPRLTLETGVDGLVTRSDVVRKGSVAVPSREGDIRVFGQPPPDQIGSDDYRVYAVNAAPYVEGDLALFQDRLHVVPGVRVDPYARSVSRALPQVGDGPTNGLLEEDLRPEPRLAVRATPTDATRFMAAYGRYGQQPRPEDLSAAFGNPTLGAPTGTHYVAGAGVNPLETLAIDATGFYVATDGLAMRSTSLEPARAEALDDVGAGRSYGVQAMARLDPTQGLYGWISYTLGWSERRDAPGLPWRPSDYDQRHSLTGLLGYELPFGIEAGVRARLATGYPRTEVVGSYYDDRRDLYQPLFGAHNAIRLPTFFSTDVRVAKGFAVGKSELDVSLEVQNVTNNVNVEEHIYDANYETRGAIRGLPILPVLGVRWSL